MWNIFLTEQNSRIHIHTSLTPFQPIFYYKLVLLLPASAYTLNCHSTCLFDTFFSLLSAMIFHGALLNTSTHVSTKCFTCMWIIVHIHSVVWFMRESNVAVDDDDDDRWMIESRLIEPYWLFFNFILYSWKQICTSNWKGLKKNF